jgi:uncharacterized protein
VQTPLQIIRKASFRAMPWKNGGGTTLEGMRVPAGAAAFRWRASIAQIDASGPFSDFAGYSRMLVLIQGAGIRLSFAGGKQRELRKIGQWLEFDGGESASCELLNGPCIDFNLMVSTSLKVDARVEYLGENVEVSASEHQSTLIFSVSAPLSLRCDSGDSAQLGPWDLAVLRNCRARMANIYQGDSAPPSAVVFATISN